MKRNSKRRGSQLIEEGLLVILALVMVGAIFGVSKSILDGVSNFFENIINSIGDLAYSLFGWLKPPV